MAKGTRAAISLYKLVRPANDEIMKIPLKWLFEAANTDDDTNTFLNKMTEAGNAVEGIEHLGKDISNVLVGQIVSLERHPDADKLWITQANVGKEVLQIVTGADNLKVGDYIPVAIHGSSLANGLKIKKSKMRGVESNGMLCSIDELGYTNADYPEASENGIYVFPDLDLEKYPLGSDARIPMDLCVDVVDFDILNNRPDTNCVMGMAREAAALYDVPFEVPTPELSENAEGNTADLVSVQIDKPELCPRYIARVVKNVKIAPSPQWMRRRLSTAGLRPINNIVDITNYVMLEYGQPLHAFDISGVEIYDDKHAIFVKTAKNGEKFTTLDGVERELSDTTLLIADKKKALAIAGIMGGENSRIADDTTTVLFESACFDAANIRRSARALGMRTDASARYEKGQDPNQAELSVNRAMELVELLACGDVVPGMTDAYPMPREAKIITWLPENINIKLGLYDRPLSVEYIRKCLRGVGIKTREAGYDFEALIPTFRADIYGEADLVEEVARFYGLNNLESRFMQVIEGTDALPSAGKSPHRRRTQNIKTKLLALGYNEAINFPFESPTVFDKLGYPTGAPIRFEAIRILNPLSEEYSIMRGKVAVGGIMQNIATNSLSGNNSAALFEIVYTFLADIQPLKTLPIEKQILTFAAYGAGMDFHTFKGDVEALLRSLTPRGQDYTPHSELPYFHPGRSADVSVKITPNPRGKGMHVGTIGEVHPQMQKNYGLNQRVYLAVFDMDALHEIAESYNFKLSSPYIYPPLERDLAFKVPEDVPAGDLEALMREKAGQFLTEVTLFDVYRGPQVGEGYKSMAYTLRFRDRNKTLSAEDVTKPINNIINALKSKFGAFVRSGG